MVLDFGHHKSAIGYVGDESPKYYVNTFAGIQNDKNSMSDDKTNIYDNCVFGEAMNVAYQNMEIIK